MLILYDTSHNKICGLVNYKDLNITREVNKLDTLSFLYPITDKNYNSIVEEGYVQTKDNEYVIKEINYSDDDYDQIICEVNIETIKGNPISHFETVEQKCEDAINLAIAGTGWTIGSCDVTKLRTVRKSQCSSYDVLQEIQNIYRCEITFDAINKKIYIYNSMGSDKGAYFSEQLNLKKIDTQGNTHDYITRLIPVGKNGLDITSVNNGVSYVENNQYSSKTITAYWSDNRYTVAQDLKDDAVARLDYLSKPQKNYSCDIYDLANISDKYKSILDYGLGDTITLLSKSRNVKEKQRIVKLVQYPDEPEKNTCDISNKLANIEDLITRFADTSDTVDDVTTSDNMLDGSKLDSFDTDNIGYVHIKIADIGDLSVTFEKVGTEIAQKVSTTDFDTQNAKIENEIVAKSDITDLNTTNERVKTLEVQSETVNTELVGGLAAKNMQTGFITADCGLIANDAIKDAMIANVSAGKINTGILNTSLVTIQSKSGNMLISDNTIQIKDSNRVRVQIGKDASSDYDMYVWDASGNLMFDATGLKASGIKDKIIRDDMVSDTANINGSKIEKESLVSQINGANTLLKASKVHLDTENQTLDVAFTSLTNTVTNQGNTVSSQGTSIQTIQGQISNKIWQQDITSSTSGFDRRNLIIRHNEILGKMVAPDGTIGDYSVSSLMNGFISVTPGENLMFSQIIASSSADNFFRYAFYGSDKTTLVQRKANGRTNFIDIVPADAAYLRVSYVTVNTVKLEKGTTATPYTEAPEDTQDQITTLTNNYSSLTQTVSGISSDVDSLQTQMNTATGNITSVTNKEDSLSQTVNGLNNTVTSVQQNYLTKSDASTTYATTSQISSLSQTVDGLSSTVSSTKTEIDGLQIGGRNLLTKSILDTQADTDGANWSFLNVNANAIVSQGFDNGAYKFVTNSTNGSLNNAVGIKIDVSALGLNTGDTITFSIDIEGTPGTSTIGGNIPYAKLTYMSSVPTYNQFYGQKQVLTSFTDINTTTFKRYSATFTIVDRYSGDNYIYIFPSIGYGGTIWYKNIKLEKGNKTTDWTPAPEDVQVYTDNAKSSAITTSETYTNSQVQILNNSIDLKVSTNTFTNYQNTTNGDISGLQSRMSSAETKITSDAIVSTVTSSSTYQNDLNGKTSSSDVQSIISQSASQVQAAFNGAPGMFTVRNGQLQVQNYYGTNVMWVDTDGKLSTDRLHVYGADNNVLIDGTGHKGVDLNSTDGGDCYIQFNNGNYSSRIQATSDAPNTLVFRGSGGIRAEGGGYFNGAVSVPYLNGPQGQSLQLNRLGGNGTTIVCDGTGSGGGGALQCGSLYVTGSKHRVVKTTDYGDRCLNAFETAECLFGDIQRDKLNNKQCVINLDPIFLETINTNNYKYEVATWAYGEGKVWVLIAEMFPNYFIVRGDSDIEFGYMIIAKQKEYENDRLKQVFLPA